MIGENSGQEGRLSLEPLGSRWLRMSGVWCIFVYCFYFFHYDPFVFIAI